MLDACALLIGGMLEIRFTAPLQSCWAMRPGYESRLDTLGLGRGGGWRASSLFSWRSASAARRRLLSLRDCHRYCLSHTQPGGLGGLQDPLPCLHTTSSWCFHTSCLIIVLFRSSVRTTRALTESSSYVVCFILHFSYAQLVGFSVSTWRITTVATHI